MSANISLLKSKNKVTFATLIIVFNFVMISMCQPALADTANSRVYSIDSKPFGNTYSDWTARWWQWLVSIPTPSNPVNDTTGKNCMVGQDGPVWFLAGPTAGYEAFGGQHSVERSCTIPSEKAVLFPVINSQCNFPQDHPKEGGFYSKDPLYELVSCANDGLMRLSSLQASIDGLKLQQLEKYRAAPSPFNTKIGRAHV